MTFSLLFFILSFTSTLIALASSDIQDSDLIHLDQPHRVKAGPEEFVVFKMQKGGWKPLTKYEIIVSWLGSVGVELKLYWQNESVNEEMKGLFRPLDTEKLYMETDERGNVKDECEKEIEFCHFTIVGYRNTRAKTLEFKKEPFEYIIRLEEIIFSRTPAPVLIQFITIGHLAALFWSLAVVSYFRQEGYLHKFFFEQNTLQSQDEKRKKE